MTFILAPLAYLFFELQIFVATIEEVAVYMSSYMAISFMVQNGLYARVRWPLISELYETAQAPYLSGVVLRTIFKPRGAKFNVTAKDEVLEEDFLSPIYRPLLVLWGITLLGVIAAWYSLASVPRRPQHPDDCGRLGGLQLHHPFGRFWARLESVVSAAWCRGLK